MVFLSPDSILPFVRKVLESYRLHPCLQGTNITVFLERQQSVSQLIKYGGRPRNTNQGAWSVREDFRIDKVDYLRGGRSVAN